VAERPKILGWDGGRKSVSQFSADRGGWMSHVRFWDDVVMEILSVLADRWPDSDRMLIEDTGDRNTVRSS
jgi:hypothetical protein